MPKKGFKHKRLFALIIIFLLAVSSVAFILQFSSNRGNGNQFWIAVTSAHGSPTPSEWINNGSNFIASVTSPADNVTNDHQWVCTGYSVDGGVLDSSSNYNSEISYTFTNVTDGHSIVFSWKEQFYINVTSSHGSPTLNSGWVDSGTDVTTSVTSPAELVANVRQWVCTGYSVDGGALASGTSYTFANVEAAHKIVFSWKEQPLGSNIKIVGKHIPPGYVMGFGIDAGLVNGMNVVPIQNSNEKISIRFTAKLGGSVTELIVYRGSINDENQPEVRIGLQEDNGGNPAGQWMNGNAFATIQPSIGSGFTNVQLPTAVNLTAGQVYHIVIEAAENPLNGTFAVTTYEANGFAQPLNPDDPDIVWNDTQMNTLFYDGQTWQKQDKWPIFIVQYSDGSSEGQPYSLSAQWVVWGSTYVGQTIIPASNYTIAKISFVVGLTGQPNDTLDYQVRDANNNILANGSFANASQLTAQRTWIEVTLSSPVTLTAGQLYRFVLLSPGTSLANAYYLFGHEFTYDHDYTIGYGALQHQLTSSLDEGANWGDNPDADAIFRLTNAG